MNILKKIFVIVVGIGFIYGLGRLYFEVTAGFMPSNIRSDLTREPYWNIKAPSAPDAEIISKALSQEYSYLGKGCQSYVFASRDGRYVIKFIKFQRFRPHTTLSLCASLPWMRDLYEKKLAEKKIKLDKLFTSWKLAYEYLKEETGTVFIHLNETPGWNHRLKITDKAGFEYELPLEKMQFLVQKKAQMLNTTIDQYMGLGKTQEAEGLIDNLLRMLLSEYMRGFADNDHALMQNTGVLDGRPIHIDAGQFIYNPVVQNEALFKREIYDKTYNFSKWLQKKHPSLVEHLKSRLVALLGVDYFSMDPYVHKGDVNKIPHHPMMKNDCVASRPLFHVF